ncbi:hypothetical protein [Acidihalobacter prosperus]|uniref:GTPase n=1 Tax=Acidihalobacter prosperus TaxID=160660 RepID=A0A1A6C7A6_9GAMM|nr:hypothetical protein [Acidihalobacter prosperus]OBS10442.1 hypothetical protein Thpro_020158 [Acidihalobacter prosperus]
MLWPSLKHRPSLDEGIPLSPRPLRRWLKALPLVDMGETTRLVYNGLLTLNQAQLPAGQRIQNMELVRESAQDVLQHLSRHFIARSLPLPPRGRKILRLLLRLHKELSTGYKLALRDAARGDNLSNKLLALATHRALRHMSLIHLQAAQMYETEPAGMWHDIHLLYAFAEEHQLTASVVKDASYRHIRQSSIAEAYLQTALLALSLPTTLRQGEAERLAGFFEKTAGLVGIDGRPLADAGSGVYLINLELDRPPAYTSMPETPALASLRGITPDKLLTHLRAQLQGTAVGQGGMQAAGTLPADLARRLLLTLTQHAKRDFARADRDERIYVAIGLDSIHRAVQADPARTMAHGESLRAAGLPDRARDLRLQTIPEQHRSHNADPTNYYDPNATSDDIWRLVVNDALWDRAAPTSPAMDMDAADAAASIEQNPPQEWAQWRLINASPGGYCISWEQAGPARAQVGELIGLRDREGRNVLWRIGLIRWMRNVPEEGLIIGIQLLAARSYQITVHAAHTRRHATAGAMDALLLPEVKALRQPGSLILPAGHFQPGDDVVITEGANESRVRLQECLQQATSFAQFMIGTIDTETPAGQESGFDALWSKL